MKYKKIKKSETLPIKPSIADTEINLPNTHKQVREKTDENTEFQEDTDFYIENGYYVFTEKYLKQRGYCCNNGCRHCPYKS